MRKSLFLTLLVLTILGASQPLWGGTVYSYAVNQIVDGSRFTTQIRLTNDDNAPHSVFYLFIPAAMNGANIDREEAIEIVMPPRTTRRFDDLVPEGRHGMLELKADDEIAVTARITGTPKDGEKSFGTELPVTDSINAIVPGKTAILQGMTRTAGLTESDFYIKNLSLERAVCAVEVRRPGGVLVVQQTLNIVPLGLTFFRDVLSTLGIENIGETSFAVTCDQLARPFGLVRRIPTAEVLFIPPSGTGRSTLDPFPSSNCPDDALINMPGTVHIPTSNNERATIVAPTTPGESFSRILLDMEFTHGGWNRVSSGNHSVLWLQRTSKWKGNLFGYLNLFGPRKNYVKLQTNVNLPRSVINVMQQGAIFEEGQTYVLSYVYDAAANFIEAVITVKGGEEVVRMTDRPSVNQVVTDTSFQVVFGHTSHEAGPEVTTYGWTYSNLCVQLE